LKIPDISHQFVRRVLPAPGRFSGGPAYNLLRIKSAVDYWGKLLGDTAAVTALLDGLLHHAHVRKCGPRSWAHLETGGDD
jgi:hypothetical protein